MRQRAERPRLPGRYVSVIGKARPRKPGGERLVRTVCHRPMSTRIRSRRGQRAPGVVSAWRVVLAPGLGTPVEDASRSGRTASPPLAGDPLGSTIHAMDHARTPEPAERRPGPASAATTAPAATVDFQPDAMVGPRGPAFGRLGPTALLGLQRTVGNAATGALLRREAGRERPAVVQREGGGPAPSPSVKHTF